MKQKIAAFHQDAENHWVADLECGHKQHMRHDPPWMDLRPVMEEAIRQLVENERKALLQGEKLNETGSRRS